jgi:hypothetical protein
MRFVVNILIFLVGVILLEIIETMNFEKILHILYLIVQKLSNGLGELLS